MLWQFVRSIDKCYHWDFPKVVIFKCSTIGAMSSSFRKAAYLWSSSSKTSPKIWFLSKVSVLLLTANLLVITLPSSCWLLFNDFEQEQWLVPFVNHAVQSPLKAYLDPIHTSKMELLRKKLTASSIFAKKLHLECMTRFEICRRLSTKVSKNATFRQIVQNSA